MIRPARRQEIAVLPQIENAADERYVRLGLRCVLEMPPHSIASLEEGRQRDMLWVATSPRNRVVGFALMALTGGTAWLDQLSVLPRWQGRGFGASLIDRTAERARELGHDMLYLSTYLDVPWNAPFYQRRGFAPLPRGVWPTAFRRQFMIENSHGHPPWRRTIMQRGI
jgi:GNAT superfamily N-acetyltransferase